MRKEFRWRLNSSNMISATPPKTKNTPLIFHSFDELAANVLPLLCGADVVFAEDSQGTTSV